MACKHTTININVLFSDKGKSLIIRDNTVYDASIAYLNAAITSPSGKLVELNLYPTYTQGEDIIISASSFEEAPRLSDGIFHIKYEIIDSTGAINCCNIYALNLSNTEFFIANLAIDELCKTNCNKKYLLNSSLFITFSLAMRILFKHQDFDGVNKILTKVNELQHSAPYQ